MARPASYQGLMTETSLRRKNTQEDIFLFKLKSLIVHSNHNNNNSSSTKTKIKVENKCSYKKSCLHLTLS